jgi:hypothetical protein
VPDLDLGVWDDPRTVTDDSRELRFERPNELDPSLRAGRYIVDERLAYTPADGLTDDEIEAAKAKGWRVMSRDELLAEWRKRT